MITKHTPRPWKVIETHYLPHEGDHVADMSNGLMVVPSMYGLGDPLADARLIAAAPDLLEALERLRQQCDRLRLPSQQKTDAEKNADAVIAKATGETP